MPGQKNLSFQDDTPQQIERIAQNKGWSQSKVVSKAVDLLDEESFEARAEGDLFEIKRRLSSIEEALEDGVGVPSHDDEEKKKDSETARTRDIPEGERDEIDEKYRSETGVDLSEFCPANGNGLNKPERAIVFFELATLDSGGVVDLEDIDDAIRRGWGGDSDHMIENYRPLVRDRLNQEWIKVIDQGDTGVWVNDESLLYDQIQRVSEVLNTRLNGLSKNDDPQEAIRVKKQFASLHATAMDRDIEQVNTDALVDLMGRAESFRKKCLKASKR